MTLRQYPTCLIKPNGASYKATFGLCDHVINGDFEDVDQAATEHMLTCPPRCDNLGDREQRHQLPDGHQGFVGSLCFLMMDGCTDQSCPCSCHH